MTNLGIKGHPTRYEEVIEILEMLGGRNVSHYSGNLTTWVYGIEEDGTIDWVECEKSLTLEEFLEKFPYKVGDKVVRRNSTSCATVHVIEKMRWNNSCVEYTIHPLYEPYSSGVDFAENLRPYKEEPMDGKLTCNEKMCLKLEALKPETGKIVFCAESPHETELVLGDNFEVKVEDGKTYVVRKLSKFPKTYEECCEVLGVDSVINDNRGYRWELLCSLQELLVCRDAYWKIAGEQMGLGKPWKPDWIKPSEMKFCIVNSEGNITKWVQKTTNKILAFPTEEMRDAFYENFKELIELVKELL